ncbi:ATP-binding protein [Streptomyces sp. NPDC086549]|uniref:ATP-binding protein n=1 Tax=Streptomyces sp. NPDC086549 TaxID=3365752 RepID=UPI00381AAA69
MRSCRGGLGRQAQGATGWKLLSARRRSRIWCRTQASEVGDACREVIDQLLEINVLYRLRAAQNPWPPEEVRRHQAGGRLHQRRLQKAKFEQQVTLEEFDFTASPKLPAAQIRDLAALRWLHAGESGILFGPVGVGKTHVAQALGHLAVRQGANVRFTKTSRILAELAGGHADRTWDERIRGLIRPDVLILDDFAMRQLTAAQADDLYELVSERQGRSLIITSNRAPSDWYPLFPNPVVDDSLLDRLINTSHQVIMNGPAAGRTSGPRTRPTSRRPPSVRAGRRSTPAAGPRHRRRRRSAPHARC